MQDRCQIVQYTVDIILESSGMLNDLPSCVDIQLWVQRRVGVELRATVNSEVSFPHNNLCISPSQHSVF